jgi:hypothetical protein
MYASFCSCVHASQSPGPGGPGGADGAVDALGAALAAGAALEAGAAAEAEGAAEGAGASLEAAGGLLGAAASGWPPPHATTEERATRRRALRAGRWLIRPNLMQHVRSGCKRNFAGPRKQATANTIEERNRQDAKDAKSPLLAALALLFFKLHERPDTPPAEPG